MKKLIVNSFFVFLIISCAGLGNESHRANSNLSKPENIKTMVIESGNNTSLLIKWTDTSNNEKGYSLQKSKDPTFSQYEQIDLPPDSNVYIDRAIEENTPYFYRVRSYTANSISPWSQVFSQSITQNEPHTPNNFTGAPVNSTSVYLSWRDNSSLKTSYELQYSRDYEFKDSHSVFLDINKNQTVLEELESGQIFYLRLRTWNGNISSEWSENISIELHNSEIS